MEKFIPRILLHFWIVTQGILGVFIGVLGGDIEYKGLSTFVSLTS